jgi:hypothetical protein
MTKRNISVQDIDVIIYPELAASSLVHDETDLYVFWQILRAIDKHRGGSGKFQRASLVSLYKHYFDVSEGRAYSRVKYGVGLYWNKFGKDKYGKYSTCLLGIQSLVDRMQPACTRSEPYVFVSKNTFDFETEMVAEGKKAAMTCLDVKYLMIACVAARYVDGRPNSIASIAELTGQSIRTVQRALKSCVDLTVYPQHLDFGKFTNHNEAVIKMQELMLKGDGFYKVVKSDNEFLVVRQIPNTYVLGQPKRFPLRKRPEALKARDSASLHKIKPKKYYQKDSKKTISGNRMKSDGLISTNEGVVGIWKGQQPKKSPTPRGKKANQSIYEKWAEQRENVAQTMVK